MTRQDRWKKQLGMSMIPAASPSREASPEPTCGAVRELTCGDEP